MRHRLGMAAAVPVAAVLVVVLAGGLAGCTGPDVTFEKVRGLPTEVPVSDAAVSEATPIAVARGTDQLVVVAWGSSTCPPMPTAISTAEPTPKITFASGSGTCTDDLAPTSFVFPRDELGGQLPAKVVVVVDGTATELAVR